MRIKLSRIDILLIYAVELDRRQLPQPLTGTRLNRFVTLRLFQDGWLTRTSTLPYPTSTWTKTTMSFASTQPSGASLSLCRAWLRPSACRRVRRNTSKNRHNWQQQLSRCLVFRPLTTQLQSIPTRSLCLSRFSSVECWPQCSPSETSETAKMRGRRRMRGSLC